MDASAATGSSAARRIGRVLLLAGVAAAPLATARLAVTPAGLLPLKWGAVGLVLWPAVGLGVAAALRHRAAGRPDRVLWLGAAVLAAWWLAPVALGRPPGLSWLAAAEQRLLLLATAVAVPWLVGGAGAPDLRRVMDGALAAGVVGVTVGALARSGLDPLGLNETVAPAVRDGAGPLLNANTAALAAATVLPWGAWRAADGLNGGRRATGVVAACACAVLVVDLVLLDTSAAWPAAAAGLLVALVPALAPRGAEPERAHRVARSALLVLAVAFIAAVILATTALRVRPSPATGGDWVFQGEVSDSLRDRILLWNVGADLAAEHPVFGHGPGAFTALRHGPAAAYLGLTAFRDTGDVPPHAHGDPWEWAADTGWGGLALLAAWLVVLGARGARDAEHGALAGTVAAVVAGGVFHFPGAVAACAVPAAVALGGLGAVPATGGAADGARGSTGGARQTFGAVLVVLVGVGTGLVAVRHVPAALLTEAGVRAQRDAAATLRLHDAAATALRLAEPTRPAERAALRAGLDDVLADGAASLATAERRLRSAARLAPHRADLHALLAEVHLRRGLVAALRADSPEAAAGARRRGLERALEAWEHALTLSPHDPALWNNIGLVRARLHGPAAALAPLNRAVALAPRDARARVHLADNLARVGSLKGAVQHLSEARRMEPDNPTVHRMQARVKTDLGREHMADGRPDWADGFFEGAVADGLEALDLGADPSAVQPVLVRAARGLADAREALGDAAGAAHWREVAASIPVDRPLTPAERVRIDPDGHER